MLDLLKKTMYAGIGLAYLTKEKVEEISQELVKKGELSEKEAKEFFNELAKKSEDTRKAVEERIEKMIKSTLQRLDLVTRDDLSALKKRITKLEGRSKGVKSPK